MRRAADSPLPPIESFETLSNAAELQTLSRALYAGDLAGLEREVAALPPEGVFFALQLAAEVDGTEPWLESTARRRPDSPLAATLLAMRYTATGWPTRVRYDPPKMTAEQWRPHQQWLASADRLLQGVHARHPAFAPAWAASITTARGLQLGADVMARRFAAFTALTPNDLAVEVEQLQTLLPKWGGTMETAAAFASAVGSAAPPGSDSAAIIPFFEIEKWVANGHGFNAGLELLLPATLDRMRDAARRSVLHPGYRFGPTSVLAHSTFALAFLFADCPLDAAPHLRALGNRATDLPWRYHPFGQGPAFATTTRDKALAVAARKGQ